ncbi:hypothetical protein V493_00632 [Pseudogymnoascus sp. VKM F-4281 (FW-2241)]|nr:hypothetical protein V493_00632 [Pseudogymnoascus sp. VKM F-4281 (FW-2241)]
MAQRARRQPRSAESTSHRSSRHAAQSISYRESSSDSIEEIDEEVYSEPSRASKRAKTSSNASTTRPRRERAARDDSDSDEQILYEQSPRKRRLQLASRTSATKKIIPKPKLVVDVDRYSAGVIPPWQTLPYQILLQIFYYASYPLVDDRTFNQTASWHWLLQTSKLCRSFSEPALTILYRSPCLTPMDRAHSLCDLLKSDQSHKLYNYRSKVEKLQIEVLQTAAYTLTGSGVLDLHGLVFHAPRLVDLEIYHQKDLSPYRELDETIKWNYPPQLFEALAKNVDGVPTRLQSWRWSSRMVSKHPNAENDLRGIIELHQTPSFTGLRKVAFVNYQAPVRPKKITADFVAPEHEKLLAEAILHLPNLEQLIFEASSLLNDKLLLSLPSNLKHLDIIACSELASEDLAEFLVTHGRQLRTLTLNHNQSLSLSFLTILGSACPHLVSLQMNLTYYNLHATFKDSEPFFDKLLLENEVPTWPTTLQTLELIQLRKWDVDAAEVFFRSLLDSAGTLPHLRTLVIKAILDTISWRDRGGFRDRWQKAFERVFKRKPAPPNAHLRSLGAYAAHKKRLAEPPKPESEVIDLSDDDLPISRSTRKPRATICDDGEPTRRTLRSANPPPKRRRVLERLSYRESSSEPDVTPPKEESTAPSRKSSRAARELATLRSTAGFHGPKLPSPSSRPPSLTSDAHTSSEASDSDDVPLVHRRRGGDGGKEKEREKEKPKREVVQGMCEVVDFKIDNLRPTENQFREEDFLDSEPEGDEDWDGTNEGGGGDGYAW